MIYITGDRHGDYYDIKEFCIINKTTKKDILIILGDAGINYYLDERDNILKEELLNLPITFFCIHGNHEERPYNIKTYKEKTFHGGIIYYEDKYPNILFAQDGEIYNFNYFKTLVIGGAYSVDKYYRIAKGYNWFKSEQPDNTIKNKVRKVLKNNNYKIDIILSHTCPFKYISREMFLSFIDQSTVDYSTEKFLNEIEEKIKYIKWYCGHYHTDKIIDNINFMYYSIELFKEKED